MMSMKRNVLFLRYTSFPSGDAYLKVAIDVFKKYRIDIVTKDDGRRLHMADLGPCYEIPGKILLTLPYDPAGLVASSPEELALDLDQSLERQFATA
jgi:hypothetical protein